VEDIVNSKRINEALLDKAEELFALEFTLKQKAQLKYMQEKQKKSANRIKLLNMLSHEYLWSPTPIYYCMAVFLFSVCRRKWALKPYTIIPFMALPATMDYVKREYYVGSFVEEKKKLTQVRKTVHAIVEEKKRHVKFEQVFRFLFQVNFDRPIDELPLLPKHFD